MKVSIIIPIYNSQEFLIECLESALNQTYENIEIIAVDDGSTDNSTKILNKYSKKIKIIRKENGGLSSALNVGIKNSSGEWIKTLDSDDVLLPNAIETFVMYAMKNNDSSKIYYSHYEIIDRKGTKKYEFIEPNLNELTNFDKNTILLDHMISLPLTRFFHKKVIEGVEAFDEKITSAEDYEFILRLCLLKDCKLFLIPKITGKYRRYSNQGSQKKRNKLSDNGKIVREKILNQIDSSEKEKYMIALKKFQSKKYPLKIKLLLNLKKIMLKILPVSISNKIVEKTYTNEFINSIYKKESSKWSN